MQVDINESYGNHKQKKNLQWIYKNKQKGIQTED